MMRVQVLATVLVVFFPLAASASYPPDPLSDVAWPYSAENSVGDVETRFNAARTNENSELGLSLPTLTLPSQAEWDAKSSGERAFWLINQERADRSVHPLDGVEANVTSVAQSYAQYLLDNDAFSHTADGRTPWERLDANPAIHASHDSLAVAENLAAFMGEWTLTVERAVYGWMYDDSSGSWEHRHTLLWYPYNDNSGIVGQEGFMGLGLATGAYQGWDDSDLIVLNVFDPGSNWGQEAIIPEPAGLGLLGLALLAVRRRRT